MNAISAPAVSVPPCTSRLPTPSTIDVGHGRQEQHEREVEGDQPLRVEPGVEVLAAELPEGLRVALLAHVGLRHAHAGQALLQVGVDRSDAVAGPVVGPARLPPEPPRRGEQRRHDGEHGEQEPPVDEREQTRARRRS